MSAPADVQASSSRHTDFIIFSGQEVEGLVLYLMVDKGPWFHFDIDMLSVRASISLFPLQSQVHGAPNMRAKCYSQMSSTFGCACLVCFYGIKKKRES